MTNREHKVRDLWETGEIIPLPRELLTHTLSDEALQDRWVTSAERKWYELRERKQELLAELTDVDEAIKEAEAFVLDARRAQERYQQTKTQPTPRPAKVQALLTRRTPEQVAELLNAASAQGNELAEGAWKPPLPKP